MNNSLAKVHPELVSEWSEKNLTLAMNVNNRMYNWGASASLFYYFLKESH